MFVRSPQRVKAHSLIVPGRSSVYEEKKNDSGDKEHVHGDSIPRYCLPAARDNHVIPTSTISFYETDHGRLRRKQRGIDKKDLQSAMKYGTVTRGRDRKNGHPTAIYQYKDIVYIVDSWTRAEVTCYAVPLTLEEVPVDSAIILEHERYRQMIRSNFDCWTSNTVIVVDTSGSMKRADVWGTRSRLSAIWVAIALDFIAHRLESGDGKPTDVISLITLSEYPTIIFKELPCTWVTYNKIVKIYTEGLFGAAGHGPFLPALQLADKLLCRNNNDACANALIFLSDGAPSDFKLHDISIEDQTELIVSQVGELARKFGRRLTFTAIGIGDKQHFNTLQNMVDTAKDYDVKAALELPSLTTDSIGVAFTSTATSTMDTQRELTNVDTLKQRQVKNVRRESKTIANRSIMTVSHNDFFIYPKHKVRRQIYKEIRDGQGLKRIYEDVPLQHPEAMYVAFARNPFGEGAERLAYRFYELAIDGRTILGKPMVAKENRYVIESDDIDGVGAEKERKKFARTFCSTQQLARRLNDEFNAKLDKIKRVHPSTPRIHFLDCSIYEIDDFNFGRLSVLVEEKLDDSRWYKWNTNNGRVNGGKTIHKGTDSEKEFPPSRLAAHGLGQHQIPACAAHHSLEILEEGSSDEDESDDDDDSRCQQIQIKPEVFSAFDIAQAFSHFTYLATGKKRLVCDLQGVFDENENLLMLSDPVIHYHDPDTHHRRHVHGRTDFGKKGVDAFFATHHEHHGTLCSLVIRGFKTSVHHRHQRPNLISYNKDVK